MGLDQHIKRKIADFNKDDFEDIFLEDLIYFRKFYPLNNWVMENCKNANHNWSDIYEIKLKDLLIFIDYYRDTKNKWWDEEPDVAKFESLIKFVESIKNKPEEIYYYTYIN